MRLRIHAVSFAVAITLLVAVACPAQIPQKMNYQVMLTDNADQPLANESVQLVFRIYDQEAGGGQLWTEAHSAATNSVGVVSVVLGTTNPLAISFDEPLWLQVEVDSEVLSPRRELTSAPYALSGTGGGGGDGHSLDADDGTPVDALYVDADGDVGIGTTSPQAELHVREEMQVGSTATRGKLTIGGGYATVSSIELVGDQTGGSVTLNASDGTPVATLADSFWPGRGARLWFSNDTPGSAGFVLDSNYDNSGSTTMHLFGDGSSVSFNMEYEGNLAVQLPDDAVSSDEILNEPEVASDVNDAGATITTSMTYPAVRSLTTAPSNGYILAIGTARVAMDHYGPSNTAVRIGLTDNTGYFAPSQDSVIMIPGAAANGQYTQPVTVHGVFSASAGLTKTVRMYTQKMGGVGAPYIRDVHLTLLFVPTAGGTVDLIDAGKSLGALDAEDNSPFVELSQLDVDNAGHASPSGEEDATIEIPASVLNEILARLDELEGKFDTE